MDAIKKILVAIYLGVFLPQAFALGDKAQNLTKKTFSVCGKKLNLEVAQKESERAMGLMHREAIPPGTGMIFVFNQPTQLNFWMRNVPFDIDIGYFDSKGRLLNALTMAGTSPLMKDEALPRYSSKGEALYAVEVVPGFYKTGNLKKCRLSPLPKGH